ncbi:MAG: hypothetical protein PW843_28085 [Azospirillaceae bacterium]|nr:hypothetical protein [Azospirillaceae bacterium]
MTVAATPIAAPALPHTVLRDGWWLARPPRPPAIILPFPTPTQKTKKP